MAQKKKVWVGDKMEIYKVGTRIREERIRKKLSQEELCYGICSVSTLSRIENGIQKPSLKVEEALLEKLGCCTDNLVFYASEEEAKKHRLEVDMGFLLMHKMSIEEKIKEYRKLMSYNDASTNLERQHFLMVQSTHDLNENKLPLEVIYANLEEALLMTIPNFRTRELYSIHLMTLAEINILNNMSVVLYRMENTGIAMKYMYFLVDYLEKGSVSVDVTKKKYPMLLYNLAKMETKIGDYGCANVLCDKGIAFCKQYGNLVPLAELYYYKAVACVKLDRVKEALRYYKYAICLHEINDKKDLARKIEQEYQNVLAYRNDTTKNYYKTYT